VLNEFVHRVSSSIERIEDALARRPFLRVTTLVMMAMILVFGAELTLALIAPWAYARVGFLYFRLEELFGFFILMLGMLMLVTRLRPDWRLEHFFFRSVLSLVTISVLWGFINFSDREFVSYVLFILFAYLFFWSFWGTHLKHAIECALMVIALLFVPFDVVVNSPLNSTDGRNASVELLEAKYGLIRKPQPGTYSMGCVVPPNPLTWVLWIDPWPLVDQVFHGYE
jgi:hypothetical protein